MSGIPRQTTWIDFNTLLTLVWLLIFLGLIYWFYSSIKRIEKTLQEIKKSLEGKTSPTP